MSILPIIYSYTELSPISHRNVGVEIITNRFKYRIFLLYWWELFG